VVKKELKMSAVSSNSKNMFSVNLSEIEGVGDFPCPKCSTVFSPDDLTKDVYTILSLKKNDNKPTSMVIQCNQCKSIINLNGLAV
jgi:hypothetical protein